MELFWVSQGSEYLHGASMIQVGHLWAFFGPRLILKRPRTALPLGVVQGHHKADPLGNCWNACPDLNSVTRKDTNQHPQKGLNFIRKHSLIISHLLSQSFLPIITLKVAFMTLALMTVPMLCVYSLVEGLVLDSTFPEVLAGFWSWSKICENNFLFLQKIPHRNSWAWIEKWRVMQARTLTPKLCGCSHDSPVEAADGEGAVWQLASWKRRPTGPTGAELSSLH